MSTSRNPFTSFLLSASIGDEFASGGTVVKVLAAEPVGTFTRFMLTMLTDSGEHVDTWQQDIATAHIA